VLLQGESPEPGSPTGKTGTPGVRTAGASYQATVRMVDQYYNLIATGLMPQVTLESSDPYDQHSAFDPTNTSTQTLSGGSYAFTTVKQVTASEEATLTATALTTPLPEPVAQSSTFTVIPNAAYRLVASLPGQTQVNGKNTPPYGLAGSPLDQKAAQPFEATVYATDFYFNRVNTGGYLTVTSNDPYVPVVGLHVPILNGAASVPNIILRAGGGGRRLTAADEAPLPNLGAADSSNFTLLPGNPVRLQVILPGESPSPGRRCAPRGNAGGPAVHPVVPGHGPHHGRLLEPGSGRHPGGPGRALGHLCRDPSTQVVDTSGAFTLTLVTAGTATVTAVDFDGSAPSLSLDQSTEFVVAPSESKTLLVIVPGESFAPGTPTGKTGDPEVQFAGAPFPVTVAVVDEKFNRVPNKPMDVQLMAPADPYSPMTLAPYVLP